MGRAHEKWHICKCLIFHAKNLLKVYTQKNSGYTKSRRRIRQQKIPKIDSKFLHIELLSREAWTSKDTRFLTLSNMITKKTMHFQCIAFFSHNLFPNVQYWILEHIHKYCFHFFIYPLHILLIPIFSDKKAKQQNHINCDFIAWLIKIAICYNLFVFSSQVLAAFCPYL